MTTPKTTTARPDRAYGRKTADQRRLERRDRLLAAALDEFGAQGFRGTTIEALCTRAGVSTRHFYQDFASREDLLIALHDDLNERALQSVVATISKVDPNDLAARALAATTAYLEVMTSDRRSARVTLVESVGVSAKAEQHRREAIDRFVALIELEAGRLAADGVIPQRDYRLTAIGLAGALNGMVSTWTASEEWEAKVPDIAAESARLITLALTN